MLDPPQLQKGCQHGTLPKGTITTPLLEIKPKQECVLIERRPLALANACITRCHYTCRLIKMAVTPFDPPYIQNPMLHANFMAYVLYFYNRGYCPSKFYIARIRIFDHLAPVTLTLTQPPLYTNLTCIPWRSVVQI